MDEAQRFGELRALAQQPPDEQAWAAICKALEEWSDRELEQVVAPYMAAHLERWPDRLRVAPLGWLDEASRGQPRAALALVRAVRLDPEVAPERAQLDLERLASGQWWAALHEITLASCGLEPAHVDLIPQGVIALSLAYNAGLGDAGVERLCARQWPKLRALDLSGCKIGDGGLWELVSCGGMERLERLALRHNAFGSEGAIEAVERGPRFAPGCIVETF